MKIISCVFIAILMGCQGAGTTREENRNKDTVSLAKQSSNFLSKHPLLTLMAKSPVEVGCILESEFNYRDSVFNCDYKNYVNKGDPCKKTTEYYEGVKIPPQLAAQIYAGIKDIQLDFEHGNLREITVTFQDSLLKSKIKEIFGLPAERDKFPGNVMSIDYGENIYSKDKPADPNYTRWLTITSFDHQGAGDVGCE